MGKGSFHQVMMIGSKTRLGVARAVVISGHVGSGKTTLSRLIIQQLRSHGLELCYDRITAFPLLSYILFKTLAVLFYGSRVVSYHEKLHIHPSTLVALRLGKNLGLLTPLIIALESLGISARLTWLSRKCRDKHIMVIDEGFINILANYIEILGGRSRYLVPVLWRLICSLRKARGLRMFYLQATRDLLTQRWIKRGYPGETPLIDIRYHLKYNVFLDIARKIIGSIGNVEIRVLDAREEPLSLLDKVIREI